MDPEADTVGPALFTALSGLLLPTLRPRCPLATWDLRACPLCLYAPADPPAWNVLACFFCRQLLSLTSLDPTKHHPLWEAYPEIPLRAYSSLLYLLHLSTLLLQCSLIKPNTTAYPRAFLSPAPAPRL